jgi:hypothetical protein
MQSLIFKVALHGISPMIWRRLRVNAETSLAELDHIIQIAMDWDYGHHSFHIYGRDFGLLPDDDIAGSGEPYEERLCDFEFDVRDRFTYICNCTEAWLCDIRIEAIESVAQDSPPPRCLSGNGKMGTDRYYKSDAWRIAIRVLDEAVSGSDTITVDDIRVLLKEYSAASFNRQKTNARLQALYRNQD